MVAKPNKKVISHWDYNEVADYLEQLHNKNFRDYAGKFSQEAASERESRVQAWLSTNNYADKAYVLDAQSNGKDWPADSEEMKLRVEINSKMPDYYNDRPYLDFWHHMTDMNDVSNGCYIYLPEVNEDTPEWIKEICGYFKDFLGDDYEEKIWVSW